MQVCYMPAILWSRQILSSFKPADLSLMAAQSLGKNPLASLCPYRFYSLFWDQQLVEEDLYHKLGSSKMPEIFQCIAALLFGTKGAVYPYPCCLRGWCCWKPKGMIWEKKEVIIYICVLLVCLSHFCPWHSTVSCSIAHLTMLTVIYRSMPLDSCVLVATQWCWERAVVSFPTAWGPSGPIYTFITVDANEHISLPSTIVCSRDCTRKGDMLEV